MKQLKIFTLEQYQVEITPTSETNTLIVKDFIDSVGLNHADNFKKLAELVDTNKVKVTRKLSSDENDKVMELHIQGQFDESTELETGFQNQWESQFVKFF